MFIFTGAKRLIASLLATIAEVVRMIPGTAEYMVVIDMIAGFFGITGIGHASVKGELSKKKLATASAAISVLLLICNFYPPLYPAHPSLTAARSSFRSRRPGCAA